MTRVLLITLLATLSLAAPAQAYTPQQVAQWNAVADREFPGHCAGRAGVRVVTSLPAIAGVRTVGYADGDCALRLVDGLDSYKACVTVVHERGHLEGQPHSTGVMAAQPTTQPGWVYRPCAQTVPPVLTRQAAIDWVDDQWIALGSLDCRRDQLASRQRCWGRSSDGRAMRWTVWMGADLQLRGGLWA